VYKYVKQQNGQVNWQWRGWVYKPADRAIVFTVKGWIKIMGTNHFKHTANAGVKIHGDFSDSRNKLGSMKENVWNYIECTGKNTHGDGGHIILIFDSLPEGYEVRYSKFTCLENENMKQ